MEDSPKTIFELTVISKIVSIRKAKGLSQNDLANFLEITRGFIGQVESANSPSTYSMNQLNRLAYKLNCSLHDFIPDRPMPESSWE